MVNVEKVNCNFCKNDDCRTIYSEGILKLVRCNVCGFDYVNPRLKSEELFGHYDDKFRLGTEKARRKLKNASEDQTVVTDTSSWSERQLCRLDKWFRDDLAIITKYKKRGKLLDIGFGDGTRLKYAFEDGWDDICGLELSDAAVNKAKEMFGLEDRDRRFYNATILDADFPKEYFDVITYWSVLEHVVNPLENIQKASELLKRGGIIVIRVPNVRDELFKKHVANAARFVLPAPMKRTFGFKDLRPVAFNEIFDLTGNESGKIGGLELELHVNHFSDRTLRMFLEKSGFRVLENRNGEGPRTVEYNLKFLAKNLLETASSIPYYLTLCRKFNFSRTLLFVAQKI